MNYTRTQRLFALIVTLTGLVLSVSPVVASELVLPQELTHEGLSFPAPLSYATSNHGVEVKKISFMTVDEKQDDQSVTGEEVLQDPEPTLLVQVTQPVEGQVTKEVLAEDIVLPTPKKEKPTPTPTKRLSPTSAPTQSLALSPTSTPTPTPIPASPSVSSSTGGLNADVIFSKVNNIRTDAGLPAYEKNDQVCAVVESRKPELENELSGSGTMHAGFRARNLPYWASENVISLQTEDAAVNWWMNSPIHKAGILSDYKYACAACQNKACAMIFSSLQPK